ncbi:MAG: carboxypeptidase-like regulatory domain-containing protein [Paludibacteraceae bacterium]|nr:carboxypeptidase-like regulatory domain-containing protein [Paludibacteraceae bacterium]
MENIKKLVFGAIATFLVLLGGCDNSKENLKNCSDYTCVDSVSNTHVYGLVCDADGNALGNVLVTSGEDSVLTNGGGAYSFDKCRVVNGRCVVKFELREFFSVVRTADISGGEARVDAVMMAQDSKEGVSEVVRFRNSQGTTIEVGGMKIAIPANSMVYEKDGKDFNGSVFASVYYLSPNSDRFTKEMPGGDMSGVTADGKSVILVSYGMVEVTLKDSVGQKLQLREGEESTLTFPFPDGFAEDQKYDKIPLWYFDEEKGTWIEEGIATKNGDTYVGNVKHFSWYNLDYPSTRATIKGRVTNKDGKPLPHVRVTISQTCAQSDNEGYYWAYVPQYTPVFVTVKPEDYADCKDNPIYDVEGLGGGAVYTQNVVLPVVPCLHGKVTDKEGSPMGGVVVRAQNMSAMSDMGGNYLFYYNVEGPFSLFVGDESVAINKSEECKKYVFGNPWEINNDKSYDFVVDRPIRICGNILATDDKNRRFSKPIPITVVIGEKEYVVQNQYSSWNGYSFNVTSDTKEVSIYVKADDGFGEESNRVGGKLDKNAWQCMPDIYVPSGVVVSGAILNKCGPSRANISIVSGHGKDKKVFSQTTKHGYFRLELPVSMKGVSAKVKIDCNGKMFTKKVDLKDYIIDLGEIEFCSGEKLDKNCIYAFIGDRTVKFNTKKDKYTEMFQRKGEESRKYQVWYKSPDYGGMLILENESASIYGGRHRLTVYLLTDKMSVIRGSKIVWPEADNIYTFSPDYEMFGDGQDDGEIYMYGSADVINKDVDDEMRSNYVSKFFFRTAWSVLMGSSDSTTFYSLKLNQENTQEIEGFLKASGFTEKSTFLDDEQRVTSIFLKDDAEAVVHRNKKNVTDVTILVRDGIGNEPLFSCWKVDFRNSTLQKMGESNINYMWKNEADIAHLVMFGPMMGVRFTKTNEEENKCGCSNGIAPAVASK